MMGRQTGDQSQLFYLFNLERRIPAGHLLRRMNPIVTRVLAELREKLAAFYSDIGRPSIDPELMLRMLIVGYCYGIRHERRLYEEVKLHLGYRWLPRRIGEHPKRVDPERVGDASACLRRSKNSALGRHLRSTSRTSARGGRKVLFMIRGYDNLGLLLTPPSEHGWRWGADFGFA